jgi:hypothetical protein
VFVSLLKTAARVAYQPQPPDPGAQVGVGARLMVLRLLADAWWVAAWVEATAPVRTRTATKARTMFFMLVIPLMKFLDLSSEIRVS